MQSDAEDQPGKEPRSDHHREVETQHRTNDTRVRKIDGKRPERKAVELILQSHKKKGGNVVGKMEPDGCTERACPGGQVRRQNAEDPGPSGNGPGVVAVICRQIVSKREQQGRNRDPDERMPEPRRQLLLKISAKDQFFRARLDQDRRKRERQVTEERRKREEEEAVERQNA